MYNTVFIIMENEKSSSFTPPKSPLTENAGNKAGVFQESGYDWWNPRIRPANSRPGPPASRV